MPIVTVETEEQFDSPIFGPCCVPSEANGKLLDEMFEKYKHTMFARLNLYMNSVGGCLKFAHLDSVGH